MASTSAIGIDHFTSKRLDVSKEDFIDHWVDLTVEKEISKGTWVRDHKRLSPREADKYLKLIKDNHQGPNPNCPQARQSRRSSPTKTYLHKKSSHASTPSVRTRKLRKQDKCPLRIVELAAPTKRHCMATVKSTSHQLPDYMLERLKFHIMDKGPIIKVHDAVECFKRHKAAASTKSKTSKNSCRSSKNDLKDSKKVLELRNMSLMFGGRVARKLAYPMELTMSPELQTLSGVVKNEIRALFDSRKIPILFYDAINNKKMLSEVSDKVAVWITTIMDDVEIRTLTEDLRAKERAKNDEILKNCIGDEEVFTLARSELEEEQGPALDALDDIVDNALKTCLPYPELDSNEPKNDQDSKTLLDGNEEQEQDQKLIEDWIDNSQEITEQGGPTDENDMFNIVDEETANPDQTNDEFNVLEPPEIHEVEEPVINEQGDAGEEAASHDNPDENVSDVLDLDDKNKKVAFLRNAGLRGPSLDLSVDNESRINMQMFLERLNNPPKPITYPKPDVDLSIVNDHLLSDADEPWPEDPNTAFKSIASVVKSVASLGMIVEKGGKCRNSQTEEEELSMTEEYEGKIFEETANTALVHDLDLDKINDDHADENQYLLPMGEDIFTSESNTTTVVDNMEAIQSTIEDELANINEENYDSAEATEKGKGDYSDLESEKNVILIAVKQKMIQVHNEARINYKVNPNSAPAWALRSNSSDDTVLEVKRQRKKMTPDELRKWCQDLNRTVQNLEQWNGWIENNCKEIFLLKQKTEANKIFSPNNKSNNKLNTKEWSRLKKNIDKDAVLWGRLKCRTTEALKAYNFTSASVNVKKRTERVKSPGSYEKDCRTAETISDMFDDFDRQCLLLHRAIISTEYCAKCKCKNFSKKVKSKPVTCLPKFGNSSSSKRNQNRL